MGRSAPCHSGVSIRNGGQMSERIKSALVGSYVGAIALGYLLAQVILRFANIFIAPIAAWAVRNESRIIIPGTNEPANSLWEAALPELAGFLLLFLFWYVMFRWLYVKPFQTETHSDGA
jgi:hypothetical protein